METYPTAPNDPPQEDSPQADSPQEDSPAAGQPDAVRVHSGPAAPASQARPGPQAPWPPHDVVVLAGGAARRLDGSDKPSLTVGGRSLLDRVLSVCTAAGTTVVVGPRRPVNRSVRWVREEPPGGGPLAALDAGLRQTTHETVLVLSADLPFLSRWTVRELLNLGGEEAAVVHDGRDQPLVAAYRVEPLRRELALLHAEYGTLAGLPLRLLLPELRLRRVPAADGEDCDTWEDLAAARTRIRDDGTVLDEWTTAVTEELGIGPELDVDALLNLARDAAHGVARPAAPLTTFLVGYAAACRGGSAQDIADASRAAALLAERWAAEESGPGASGTGTGGE